MNAPLRMSFDVACSAEHAFTVWTSGIGRWWPPDHTVTGQADLVVILQSGVGGRIYERTSDGVEHDWGEVTVWKPPTKLAYLWHLRGTARTPPRWRSTSSPKEAPLPESRSSTGAGSNWETQARRGAIGIVPAGRRCCHTFWP